MKLWGVPVLIMLFIAVVSCDDTSRRVSTVTDSDKVTETDEDTAIVDTDINDDNPLTDEDELIPDDDSQSLCRNGTVDYGEICDGNFTACTTSGVAPCKADCSGYDYSVCPSDSDSSVATISGDLLLYHPSNKPSDAVIPPNFDICDPVGGEATSPYGDIYASTFNMIVSENSQNPDFVYSGVYSGEFADTSFGQSGAVSYAYENNGYIIMNSFDIINNSIGETVVVSYVDKNISGTVEVGKNNSAFILVLNYDSVAKDYKCLEAIAYGKAIFNYSEKNTLLCSDGEKSCNGTVVTTCSSETWIDGEDCALSGKICDYGECIAEDSSIDTVGPEYSGNSVLILNSSFDGETPESSGTIPQTALSRMRDENVGSNFMQPKINPMPLLPKGLGRPSKIINKRVTPPAIGETASFYMYDYDNSNYYTKTAYLVYTNSLCEIWSDMTPANFSLSNAGLSAQEVANEFADNIYPMVTTHFYPASDVNNDGKIALFITDLGGYAAGYFSSGDFYSRQEYPYSNERDMLYIDKSQAASEMFGTMAHEFQHLVHSNRNVLEEGDYESSDLPYRWIDEGLAMSSEHMYHGALSAWIAYLEQDQYTQNGNSFLYWDYSDYDKVYSDYSMTYMFFQYVRLRFDPSGSIFKEIIEDTHNSYIAVDNAIKAHGGAGLKSVMRDFRIALQLQRSSGAYGFQGESDFDITIPYYTGTSVNLRGGGAVYVHSNGTFTAPSNAGSDITFVGFDK